MPILSCASLSADGFFAVEFDRAFAMLPAAGYRHVEFNLWPAATIVPEYVRTLRARCDDVGLAVSSVHGEGVTGRQIPWVEAGYLFHMMTVAETLGCRRICFTGGNREESNGALQGFIDVLSSVVSTAEERGIIICLENHAGNTLETIEDYEVICNAIPSPNVGICIDTGHFDASGVSMDDLIDRLGNRVVHLHLKENHGTGTVDFRRFGEGTTDNAHVVERLMELGFEGYMVCELSPQKDRESTVEDLRTAFDMFSAWDHTVSTEGVPQ